MTSVASVLEEILLKGVDPSPQTNKLVENIIAKLRMKLPVNRETQELFLTESCPREFEINYSCPGSLKDNIRWPYAKDIQVNQNFTCIHKLTDLTILLNFQRKSNVENIVHLIESIAEAYSFVRITAAVPRDIEDEVRRKVKYWADQIILVPFDKNSSEVYRWKYMTGMVKTSMVLVGRDLDYFGSFSNLDRSINLLEKYGDSVLAVGGSRRLREGYWTNGCSQIEIESYAFRIQNGYKKSTCDDCMLCSYLRGPFITLTQRFIDIPLEKSVSLVFLKWFYDHSSKTISLSCPDLLYLTNEKTFDELEGNREEWKNLGRALEFQSVILEKRTQSEFQFSCNEMGLKCTPRSSADSFLLPYCCTKSYNYVIERLENVSTQLGIDYELDSGSLLGAVKLNNFIPWDIDGDIYIRTGHIINFFDSGGKGRELMKKDGFVLSGVYDDNYADVGARYFNLYYGGVTFEMMGSQILSTEECAEFYRDRICKNQTKVLLGSTWARVHANPGKYIRLRYGPGYLRHATSWRYNDDQQNSFETYGTSGKWNLCRRERHHSCLNAYAGDGNIKWLPSNYPGNE